MRPSKADGAFGREGEGICDFFRDSPLVIYMNTEGKQVRLWEVLCDGESRISLKFFAD
ncbi:hypothetical protein ACFL6M_07810 [Candidatus Eisenbacteria bacterium]|uniref:Uncharacterized protein n=1 Tax=Eiseniibacteriota bacterium TaxID=2212470 RepID=A0ABV6YMS5_UNCEI